MKSNRRLDIEKFIALNERVSMDELVEHFNVSMNTIRNDIKYLVKKGTVMKVYGGVERKETSLQTEFDIRDTQNKAAKELISQYAASLIHEGDVIFCDSGTTIRYLLNHLDENLSFTLITHNLELINTAMDNPAIDVISLPGLLARNTRSFLDQNTVKLLKKYNISKSFISTRAISVDGELTNSSELECEIKKTAIQQSKQKYLLCDTSKFGKASLLSFYQIDKMDLVITAGESTQESTPFLKKENVLLIPFSAQSNLRKNDEEQNEEQFEKSLH